MLHRYVGDLGVDGVLRVQGAAARAGTGAWPCASSAHDRLASSAFPGRSSLVAQGVPFAV